MCKRILSINIRLSVLIFKESSGYCEVGVEECCGYLCSGCDVRLEGGRDGYDFLGVCGGGVE